MSRTQELITPSNQQDIFRAQNIQDKVTETSYNSITCASRSARY